MATRKKKHTAVAPQAAQPIIVQSYDSYGPLNFPVLYPEVVPRSVAPPLQQVHGGAPPTAKKIQRLTQHRKRRPHSALERRAPVPDPRRQTRTPPVPVRQSLLAQRRTQHQVPKRTVRRLSRENQNPPVARDPPRTFVTPPPIPVIQQQRQQPNSYAPPHHHAPPQPSSSSNEDEEEEEEDDETDEEIKNKLAEKLEQTLKEMEDEHADWKKKWDSEVLSRALARRREADQKRDMIINNESHNWESHLQRQLSRLELWETEQRHSLVLKEMRERKDHEDSFKDATVEVLTKLQHRFAWEDENARVGVKEYVYKETIGVGLKLQTTQLEGQEFENRQALCVYELERRSQLFRRNDQLVFVIMQKEELQKIETQKRDLLLLQHQKSLDQLVKVAYISACEEERRLILIEEEEDMRDSLESYFWQTQRLFWVLWEDQIHQLETKEKAVRRDVTVEEQWERDVLHYLSFEVLAQETEIRTLITLKEHLEWLDIVDVERATREYERRFRKPDNSWPPHGQSAYPPNFMQPQLGGAMAPPSWPHFYATAGDNFTQLAAGWTPGNIVPGSHHAQSRRVRRRMKEQQQQPPEQVNSNVHTNTPLPVNANTGQGHMESTPAHNAPHHAAPPEPEFTPPVKPQQINDDVPVFNTPGAQLLQSFPLLWPPQTVDGNGMQQLQWPGYPNPMQVQQPPMTQLPQQYTSAPLWGAPAQLSYGTA